MSRTMKDSGIEWIGDVPEEWEVHPFKAYYKTTKGLNITKENLVERGIPVISYGQIHSKLNTGTSICDALIRYVPETYLESNPECLSKKYDIFFADTSEDVEGAGNIAFVDTDTPIFAGYHTIIARPQKEVKTKYFAYLAKTDAWRTQIRNSLSGVKVFSISQKLINRVYIILPPLAEQHLIATFLDKKCSEIDSLIDLQEQMIEELKAYKQSVITEAVTKGLNPDAPMRDSGIDWIDTIPNHWIVRKMKSLIDLKSGSNLTSEQISDKDDGYPVYGGNGLRGTYSEYSNEGDYVLVGRQGALCGNINYASGKFWVTEHALVCYPKEALDIRWLGESLRAMNLNQYSLSAAQPGLSAERIKNLYMIVPPLAEQQAIADYLDKKCGEIDELITIKQQKIESLKEYKKSVIYEYVTGKREVE